MSASGLQLFLLIFVFVLSMVCALPIDNTHPYSERIVKSRASVQGLGIRKEAWIPEHVPFFEHNEQFEIQPNDDFWLAWTPYQSENLVSFTLAVKTVGWIGWGPSETGGMVGGNPCVVRQEGSQMYAFAYHSDGFYTPTLNADQNCQLTSYSIVGNETLLSFTRPLLACAPEDVHLNGENVYRMIAAWGTSQNFVYHGVSQRFTFEIDIILGPIIIPPLPPDVQEYHSVLLPMEIPAYRDVYYCRGHRFPQDRRYHIILNEALMYNVSPAIYHHALVFSCPGGLPREWADPNYQAPCAVVYLPCSIYQTGWAAGQQVHYYEHGLPIGAGEGATKEYLFQSHIDNPESTAGIFDQGWGLVFSYTPTLTEIESGTFGLYSGVPMGGIPGGIAEFRVISECAGRMTESAFPNGIYINAVTPHMHAIAIDTSLEILRQDADGNWFEVIRIWQQNAWDSNWQGNRFLRDPGVRVEPGDRLRVRCGFNSLNRTTETRNGEGYEDEMCIHYISYYPRESISICAEFPPSSTTHPDMSGPGVTFADVPPFLFPIGPSEYLPLPSPPNNCNSSYSTHTTTS